MTNKDIIRIAMEQSAIDSNCEVEDFTRDKNIVVISKENENARKDLELPFLCNFTSYGNNIVASVSEPYVEVASVYMNRYPLEYCFGPPNLYWFNDKIKFTDAKVCFIAEYFLPNVDKFPVLECEFETKVLTQSDFKNLYVPEWSHALSEDRKHLDVLGVGAYYNGALIGLAACSADSDTMWQIGVDVLPAYRKKGIASAITNQLSHEILNRNIVPFYCCAWSNMRSVRNAIKSGFIPTWVQMTVKSNAFINDINNIE